MKNYVNCSKILLANLQQKKPALIAKKPYIQFINLAEGYFGLDVNVIRQGLMKPPLAQGRPNDFQTPPEALKPLLLYLKKEWVIWECACGKGNLAKELERLGYDVIATDLYVDYGNEPIWNFLADIPAKPFDCIITNPPFSLKQQFLERCYQLGKPFALLLPLTTFETKKRQELFKKYGVEVILFDKRINFETPSGKGSGSWFATAWWCYKFNLPAQLNVYHEKQVIPISRS